MFPSPASSAREVTPGPWWQQQVRQSKKTCPNYGGRAQNYSTSSPEPHWLHPFLHCMPPFLCFSLPGSPVMVLCPSQIKNLLLLVLIPLAPVCCHDTPLFGVYDSIMVMPLQSAIHKVTILFLLSTRYFFPPLCWSSSTSISKSIPYLLQQKRPSVLVLSKVPD